MNFYGINSHSSFAIRLQYDELGLFIIIRPGCQKQLYCSPKTGCKITCLCAASIKMELLLLLEFRGVLFYSCGQSGITVSASFSFPQTKVLLQRLFRQSKLGLALHRTWGTTEMGVLELPGPRSLSNRIRVNTRPAQPRLHPAEPPWTVIPWPLQDLSQGCPLLTVKKMSESGKEKWG